MATTTCKHCQSEVEVPDGFTNPFIKCGGCGKWTSASAAGGSRPGPGTPPPLPPARPAAPPRPAANVPLSKGPSPAPTGASSSDMETLPEIMKANKKLAGRVCPGCEGQINLGDQVHNCPTCRGTNHQACWSKIGGCGSHSCRMASPSLGTPGPTATGRGSAGAMAESSLDGPPSGNMIPCRFCREPIVRGAKKCKHCNEWQSDADREKQAQMAVPEGDADPSIGDWIVIVLCPCIGCLAGTIWALQGKPKGGTTVKYSLLFVVLWNVLSALGGR